MSSPKSAEVPSLASLSLEDDHSRATLPPGLVLRGGLNLDWEQKEAWKTKNLQPQKERFAQALRQTKKRWSWFVQAKTRDNEQHTSLGTLGYLPLEIRVKIYALVLNTQVRSISDWGSYYQVPRWRNTVMRDGPPMSWMHFNYQACAFGCWNGKGEIPNTDLCPLNLRTIKRTGKTYEPHRVRPRPGYPGPLNLRTYFAQVDFLNEYLLTPFISVSRSLRDDFGDYMIGSRNISFRCSASFAHFLRSLSQRQIASLRRITIDLTGPDYPYGCRETVADTEAWASAFTDLPSELGSLSDITIMVGEDAPSFKDEEGNAVAWYQDDYEVAGSALLPLYGIDKVTEILRRSSCRNIAYEAMGTRQRQC